MTCEDFIPFIDAYVDQEFDERERAEMEMHLAMCEACRERVEFQIEFKQQFKVCLGQEKAPASLRERIMGDLEQQVIASTAPPSREPVATPTEKSEPVKDHAPRRRRIVWRHAWVAAPLAAAVAVVVLLPGLTVAPATSDQLPVVEQTVDWHKGNYPIEVTGPDAGNVSQWFRNKVDFPVRIPQFSGERQVNLLGGRIAHIQDRRAAYLLYEVDGSRLSVLVFNGDGLMVPGERIRKVGGRDVLLLNKKGYEVAVLQDHGVTYALTSELSQDNFVELIEASVSR